MIKKVGNWVFGSFFRTMGRFFFFLFFGFLLATILSKSEIKITDLLGIETVKADTIYPTGSVFYDDNGNELSDLANLPIWTRGYTRSYVDISQIRQSLNFWLNNSHNDSVVYTYPSGASYVLINVYFWQFYPEYTSIYNYNNNQEITSTDTRESSMVFYLEAITNGTWSTCNLESSNKSGQMSQFVVKCPLSKNSTGISRFVLNYSLRNQNATQINSNYSFGLGYSLNYIIGTDEAIINNQNQNTNQTISTITDTNTTEADSQATNFFDNFTSQDNGGISSIITAPLQSISGLVSATCTPITLPLPYLDNKTIVLPCMSAIYQEHFGAFFTIYQTIIFGALAYRMLVSIFMMIQGFKNPDDDKIEVVDL